MEQTQSQQQQPPHTISSLIIELLVNWFEYQDDAIADTKPMCGYWCTTNHTGAGCTASRRA